MIKNYKVYKHTSPSNKVYIGITKQNPLNRWHNGKGYISNDYFWRAIEKYGWGNFKHDILATNLTKDEAEQMEIELIKKYKSNMRDFGYNLDNGGNCIGSFSDEHRRKMSEAMKERCKDKTKHPKFGTRHSEETRSKISKIHKGKRLGEQNHRYGVHHTEDAKRKIREANIGRWVGEKSAKARKIVCVETGEIFNAVILASRQYKLDPSSITKVCKGKRMTAGNFHWRYYD